MLVLIMILLFCQNSQTMLTIVTLLTDSPSIYNNNISNVHDLEINFHL